MFKLREIREEKKLQQKDIAIKLNRTIACISSWETGKTEPGLEDLRMLANLLDVPVDYLIGRTDDYGFLVDNQPNHYKEIESYLSKLSTSEQYQVLGFIKSFLINKK